MARTAQFIVARLVKFPVDFARYLLLAFSVLITLLWWVIRFLLGHPTRGEIPPKRCPGDIPPHIRRKPDSCLYSQAYLMGQGMPVTWDNPDIWLTETDGTPVDSSSLQPNHHYILHGRIWNASFNPALGVEVRAAYRNWGLGGPWLVVQHDPGSIEHVEILVINPWGHAMSRFHWHTPAVPGHYCIRVACHHPDDKNPANNVGQENTNIVAGQPGHKLIVPVPITNDSDRAARVLLFADTYKIPPREWGFRLETRVRRYGDKPPRERASLKSDLHFLTQKLVPVSRGPTNVAYAYKSRAPVVEAQQNTPRDLPQGWTLKVDGQAIANHVALAPHETRDLQLEIDIPATAPPGQEVALNLNAVASNTGHLAGVTLVVRTP
jgi:hypothetical protein